MGHPLGYTGISFQYLWENVSIQALEEYASRLKGCFQQYYKSVGFSEDRFIETFQPHLRTYNPHGNITYDFEAETEDIKEAWKLQLRLTQISNLEGGIVKSAPSTRKPNLDFARTLLVREAASMVTCTEFLPRKGIKSVFGKDIYVNYLGSRASIYVLLKIESIDFLLNKLRWEPLDGSDFKFIDFAKRIESILGMDDSIYEVSFSSDYFDDARAFIRLCDDRIKTQLSETEVNDLFKLVSLPSNEWFNAKVF